MKNKKTKINKILKPRKDQDGDDYYFDEDIKKMLTNDEYIKFNEWISGQTGSFIDGKCAIFAHDVNRFLRMIREGIPTYFD